MLSIFKVRPVEPTETHRCKIERHFPIYPGQPSGRVLSIFHSFPQFSASVRSDWTKVRQLISVSRWNGKFRSDRSKWTTFRGGPEYSGHSKPKRTSPFDFRPCHSTLKREKTNWRRLLCLLWFTKMKICLHWKNFTRNTPRIVKIFIAIICA